MIQTRPIQLLDAEAGQEPNQRLHHELTHHVARLRRGLRDVQRPLSAPRTTNNWWQPAVFEPEDLVILRSAYDEACAFLDPVGLTPARRQEIAFAIILHARRGVLDPHRLALKAIAAV